MTAKQLAKQGCCEHLWKAGKLSRNSRTAIEGRVAIPLGMLPVKENWMSSGHLVPYYQNYKNNVQLRCVPVPTQCNWILVEKLTSPWLQHLLKFLPWGRNSWCRRAQDGWLCYNGSSRHLISPLLRFAGEKQLKTSYSSIYGNLCRERE